MASVWIYSTLRLVVVAVGRERDELLGLGREVAYGDRGCSMLRGAVGLMIHDVSEGFKFEIQGCIGSIGGRGSHRRIRLTGGRKPRSRSLLVVSSTLPVRKRS